MPRETCNATRDDGEPCTSPIVGEDGRCPAHREGARERLREAGRKGAKATARRFSGGGLEDADLPPLVDADAAEVWCDVVGRAAVTGRIGHNEAKAALKAVREWRESHEAGKVSDRLDALTDALARWRETGDPEPVLAVVEGGHGGN